MIRQPIVTENESLYLVLRAKNETIDGLTALLSTMRADLANARVKAIKDCAGECEATYQHLWAKSREQVTEAEETDWQAKATGAPQCFHTLCEMAAKEGTR